MGCLRNNYNPKVLEHYTNIETGRDIWNDYVSITIKDKKHQNKFIKRTLDFKKNYTNGRKDNSDNILNFQEFPQDQANWGWKIYYKWRKFLHKIKKIWIFIGSERRIRTADPRLMSPVRRTTALHFLTLYNTFFAT